MNFFIDGLSYAIPLMKFSILNLFEFKETKIVIIVTIYSVLTILSGICKLPSLPLIFTTDYNNNIQQTTYKHIGFLFPITENWGAE